MADFLVERVACIDPRERAQGVVDRALIVNSASLQPCAAVTLAGTCAGQGFAGVSVYLERAQGTGAVPAVFWELRARHGGASQSEAIPAASGQLNNFSAWTSEGSIVHTGGRLCLGFELWARNDGPAAIPCTIRFVTSPASSGVPLFVSNGVLV